MTRQRKTRAKKKVVRTTHRSKSGKKLYAVRDAHGRFKDVQTYKRAHGSDIKRAGRPEKGTGSTGPRGKT